MSIKLSTVWFLLFVLMIPLNVTGQDLHEDLRNLEQKLVSKLENLQEIVSVQREEIKKQNQRIGRLEKEIKQLNKTSKTLTKKMNDLSRNNVATQAENKISGEVFHKIPRTCNELKTLNPLAESGSYSIDPDGPNNGDEPIQVFCNTSTGTTIISHDSEGSINVLKCSSPGCYSKQIVYNATQKQVAALVNLSKSCRQYFQYDCLAAPFEFTDKNFGWWLDRNGSARYTWAGGNVTAEHTCECGILENCSDPSVKCNCDSLAPEMQSDKGYITDMSSLPVTQLNFGRTNYASSKAVYTLGKLECSGTHQLKAEPASCGDLWRSGNTFSGIFLLRKRLSLNLVFCDFSEVLGVSGFEKNVGVVAVRRTEVKFHAYTTKQYKQQGIIISFTNVTLNIGNAFDSENFTAPVTGLYYFAFVGWKRSPVSHQIALRKSTDRGYFNLSVKTAGDNSIFITTYLIAGEKLHLFLEIGYMTPAEKEVTFPEFSGQLLWGD